MLRRQISERDVDKGKLTAVASFEKPTFRARALHRSKVEDYGLCVFIYWGVTYKQKT